MDMTNLQEIKEILLRENQVFRELAQKHQSYEKRLSEIASLTYPSEEELLEESILKKKKLAVKDEMYEMMSRYSASS
jgi:uncharacterized protein YdcH (DUF465 family)